MSITGQQSATDAAELTFQPGYWLPWEQADPLVDAPSDYIDYTFDPIGHIDWRIARSDKNKTSVQPSA